LADSLGAASAGLLSISLPRLPAGDFSQPLAGTSAFQVAELKILWIKRFLTKKKATAFIMKKMAVVRLANTT
jgi:hypothetical protein